MRKRQSIACYWASLLLAIASFHAALAQVNSGPDVGSSLAPLPLTIATGDRSGEEIDGRWRGDKPTIYLFVQADKWDRPVARFVRGLDDELVKNRSDIAVVAVWLTEDIEKSKEYLPLAQQSLQLRQTSLAVFRGDKNGPADWSIHSGAHLTAVIADSNRVVARFGYRSLNETNVPEVLAKLPPAK
jgi:hypothetical protein